MKFGPAPNATKPDFLGARTRWDRGFMAVQRIRGMRIVVLAGSA